VSLGSIVDIVFFRLIEEEPCTSSDEQAEEALVGIALIAKADFSFGHILCSKHPLASSHDEVYAWRDSCMMIDWILALFALWP
jgi:hypothetical protein